MRLENKTCFQRLHLPSLLIITGEKWRNGEMEARPSFSIANKIFFASLPRPALPYVQTDATTPNIVGPAMLTVVARS